ncbi:hypothetical protein [Brasilonema sp. UFV-L1]
MHAITCNDVPLSRTKLLFEMQAGSLSDVIERMAREKLPNQE